MNCRTLAGQLRRVLLLCSLLVLCLSTPAHAQLWSGILDPSRAVDWSQAGIPGGIPTRTTICATLNPGATPAQINSAIASCPAGQVVFLTAGTYNISGGITFNGQSNVTLRGAGPDKTFLVFSGSNGCGGLGADICVINPTGYGPGGFLPAGNTANWTAGYAKGTTQITLGNVAGLSAGSIIVLDQLDDTSDNGGVFVCQTNPGCATENPGGQGRSGRGQMQFVRVTAIVGNVLTITPGLYMPNWRSSQSPGAWWTGPQAESDGVEDLSMDHTNTTGNSGVYFFNAHNGWLKNVRSMNAKRNHVWLYQSAHIQVQDNYFYGTQNAASQSYAIESYGSADNLVQNNIFQHVTAPMVIDNTEGTVFAYNYSTDDYYNVSGWMIPSIVIHAGGVGMILFEGNDGSGLEADAIHGTSDFVTGFRNVWLGWEPGKTQQTVPVHLYAFHRYFNLLGNVLGRTGTHTQYEDAAPSGTNGDASIYTLGWSGNESTFTGVPDDTLVKTTLMRWGNYDVVTGTSRFVVSEVPSVLSQFANPVPPNNILPASLYLSAKPSWFGSGTWPPIGPDVTGGQDPTGHAYNIPSKLCYNNTAKDANGILLFNANNCYNTAPDTTPPTVSLTAPANGAAVSGAAVTISATASDNGGVAGVQFKLDGVNLGAEDSVAPYSVTWNTTLATPGTHTLTAVARDAVGNTATSAAVGVTVDNTPPLISTVSASSISSAGAIITWATNEAGDSQVDYGLTTAYGSSTPLNTSLLTAHAMTLTGLLATTTYHYRVKSRDAAGNLATSADFTLTTLIDTAPPTVSITSPLNGTTVSSTITVSATATDNVGVVGVQFQLDGANVGAEVTAAPYTLSWNTATASNGLHTLTAVARDAAGNTATATAVSVTVGSTSPLISTVSASNVSSSGATITWTTNETSTTQVEYGLTPAYGNATVLNTNLVTSHSQALSGLARNTWYHYRVKSQDAAGNLAASGDFVFKTKRK